MMSEDREILAAEYVVGTLDQIERAQAERLIATDSEFAAAVRAWERRLGELNAMVEPVEPPAAIWNAIRAGSADDGPGGAEIIDLTAGIKRWRNATYVASALAATLLLFVAVREFYPGARPADGGRFVAVLQRDAVSPGFLLTVDSRPNPLRCARSAPTGRAAAITSYGWCTTISRRRARLAWSGRAISPPAPPCRPTIPPIINEATYAVSIEPPGGSPTGAPTGPVVFTGKLIEAERYAQKICAP